MVVKPFGPPRLCMTDEVGEICLYAHSTGSAYWGLDGLSGSTFKVQLFFLLCELYIKMILTF